MSENSLKEYRKFKKYCDSEKAQAIDMANEFAIQALDCLSMDDFKAYKSEVLDWTAESVFGGKYD